MSQLSIRLTPGYQTSDEEKSDTDRFVTPATPYSPDLSAAVAPIINGDVAKLFSLILSDGLDLSARARMQRAWVQNPVST